MAMRLEDYAKMVKGKPCRWCGTRLPGKIEHYPHADGWEIDGFPTRLWLYVVCPKCGYEWALWKLGVPREVVVGA